MKYQTITAARTAGTANTITKIGSSSATVYPALLTPIHRFATDRTSQKGTNSFAAVANDAGCRPRDDRIAGRHSTGPFLLQLPKACAFRRSFSVPEMCATTMSGRSLDPTAQVVRSVRITGITGLRAGVASGKRTRPRTSRSRQPIPVLPPHRGWVEHGPRRP